MPIHNQSKNKRRNADSFKYGNQRIVAKIAHHGPVHTGANKQWNGDQRRCCKQPKVITQGVNPLIEPQADDKRQPQGRPDQYNIDSHLEQTLVTTGQPDQGATQLICHPFLTRNLCRSGLD